MSKRSLLTLIFILISVSSCTTLHKAAKDGNFREVKNYVGKGSDINAVDRYGYTPLILAAYSGHIDSVKYLAEHGADIDIANKAGETALMVAAQNGHIETAKYLIDNGADLDVVDDFGNTALINTAFRGHTEIAKYLIDNNANININRRKKTAFTIAASKRNVEMVQLLAEGGAEVPDGKALVMFTDHIYWAGNPSIAGFKRRMGWIAPGEYHLKVKYEETKSGYRWNGSPMPVALKVKAGGVYFIKEHVVRWRKQWEPMVVKIK
jgi:ankyrin repeat protein